MSFTHSQLINYQTLLNCLHVEILYPKLVIFEGSCIFRILDLKCRKIEDYTMDDKIVFIRIIDDLLWIILKSGQIIVMNIFTNTKIKLITNLMIRSVQSNKGTIILYSESEEHYETPFTTKELDEKLTEGLEELVLTLKTTKWNKNKEMNNVSILYGLHIFIENGKLNTKCLTTGLTAIIDTDLSLEYFVKWEENLVISSRSQMFVFDLSESKIVYNFENKTLNYYPLVANHGCLYYLMWSKNKVGGSVIISIKIVFVS